MIAMSIANNPDLLIADEPTTALDVTIQLQILDLLKSIQKKMNMSILFISHDLAVVKKIADYICIMKDGHIVEQNTKENIFSKPQHDYTKKLIFSQTKKKIIIQKSSLPILKVNNLKVWYPIKKGILKRVVNHVKAVNNISFNLNEKQTLGIVGESGSGKTSLVMALLKLIKSEGNITFKDHVLGKQNKKILRSLRKKMQIVFQDPYGSLSPRMTVQNIVEEGLRVHEPEVGSDQRRERVAEGLNEVGLEAEMMDRYPHEFSGGQRQRISIARAMVLRPKFVVLDEPTSALDMSVQAQIVDLLRALQAKHELGYLFVSHDLKVVRALANWLIVMRDGEIVEQGPAREVFEPPSTDYARALFDAALDMRVDEEFVRQ